MTTNTEALTVSKVEQLLSSLEDYKVKSIPLAGLISRNSVVYGWKGPLRCWLLREAALWRIHDLLQQSYLLHRRELGLGARILLRSAFETLAALIYLSQQMNLVVSGGVDFHEFDSKVLRIVLGSRNQATPYETTNVITILQKCDRKYPNFSKLYADLSECAHPSYEGLLSGYSRSLQDEYETSFGNRWHELHGSNYMGLFSLLVEVFVYEYDDEWTTAMTRLEEWVETNNDLLETTKPQNSQPNT